MLAGILGLIAIIAVLALRDHEPRGRYKPERFSPFGVLLIDDMEDLDN